jgi:hypothetical protein
MARDRRYTHSRVDHPALPALRRRLVRRLARNGALVGGLLLGAVGLGTAGYHVLGELPWLDAALNATMILAGMGPVDPITTPSAKVFAIGYALFSGVFFLTMTALLLAPALQHLLHRFHLELGEQQAAGADGRSGDQAAPPDHARRGRRSSAL